MAAMGAVTFVAVTFEAKTFTAMTFVTGVMDVPFVPLMRDVRGVMAVSAASVSVSHAPDIGLDIS